VGQSSKRKNQRLQSVTSAVETLQEVTRGRGWNWLWIRRV